ncbi:hypothetical protein FHX74_002790 [Friedmanniella endophytica]|uniref:Uncharacterized protein n=1 Tax=Microlunatus kandeliicorticis TaxID=1759536 RepID=A0A7W3P6P2_9ACTN|nr:polysialyltransferase family glycosyltransferase [Microlunatus kandeliicorticis]MBA8795162.1 hypothetical protein [Microlunatus kandeliicorticis]
MSQLVVASTFYQCLSLAAAVDVGALPDPDGERILLLADSSQAPELSVPLDRQTGFAEVAKRFDRVIDLAPLVAPRRPVQFAPRADELEMWSQLLVRFWELDAAPGSVIMDSVQVNPAPALARIFRHAELWTHSDGLMTYSPTRKPLPTELGQRIRGLCYVDLVPGLRPQLLAEHRPEHRTVPAAAVREVLRGVVGTAPDHDHDHDADHDRDHDRGAGHRPHALVLGQYLPSLGLISTEEETELHRAMIAEVAGRGIDRCVFKKHPSAPPAAGWALREIAAELGVTLVVDDGPGVAELAMIDDPPALVVSCFSTGLATARFLLGLDAVAVGTPLVLGRLTPYANSNRIPLVIADALFAGRGGGAVAPGAELDGLVAAVAYCMQPTVVPQLRPVAVAQLARLAAEDRRTLTRYFTRRRLTRLDLPGQPPQPSAHRRALSRLKRRTLRLPVVGTVVGTALTGPDGARRSNGRVPVPARPRTGGTVHRVAHQATAAVLGRISRAARRR